MQCKVLHTRTARSGMKIAHVQAGEFFGDVPAEESVQNGNAFLQIRLRVRAGRLEVASLRVYPETAK